ncbi:MAG: hypothetical protein LBC62_09715 [Treponema sp.]|jgi:hypothetical protein|nr:hypothetical protein [Treponema sp.]
MAKISAEDRHQYFEKIKPYKLAIASYLKREETVLSMLKKGTDGAAFKRLVLVEEMIGLASNYIILSGVSQSMLKLRNEEALNDGRKSLYKAVIYLEEIVSNLVDTPFSEYEEKLGAIAQVDPKRRYLLVRKLGLVLQLLENAYGDNTKWKWAFVELEGRYAAAVKNILDLKNAVANTDPRSPDYEPTVRHILLIKKLLAQAAGRYREKYELSTNRIDDFKMGIHFLVALRRFHMVLGENTDADTVKKKLDIWTTKLEVDIKKQEEAGFKKISNG